MKRRICENKETSEISLRLEQYDDIFSDFDVRHYSKRSLSVDFLEEIKRASLDKCDAGIDLILHVPQKKRKESQELTIKERLAIHFKKHYHLLLTEKRRIIKLGISMVTLGILCMVGATLVVFKNAEGSLLLSFLVIFLEPAAWFLLWEGMDQVLFNSKEVNADLTFYRKMADSSGHIHFQSY